MMIYKNGNFSAAPFFICISSWVFWGGIWDFFVIFHFSLSPVSQKAKYFLRRRKVFMRTPNRQKLPESWDFPFNYVLSKPRDGCLGSGFWKFLPITHHSTAHSMDCKKQSEGRTFVQHCKCTSLVPNPLSAIHNRLVLCHHISSHILSNISAAHTELRRKKN